MMLKNYIKIAFRNLRRNKIFSGINILGLAIGMASALIIMLWIQHEISYDTFHEKKARIYEAWNQAPMSGEIYTWHNTPKVLARTMEKDFPEVEQVARIDIPYPHLLKAGEKSLIIPGCIVDSNFLQIFSFPLLQGDNKTVLNDIHSIAITQTLSKKLFGNENAMGNQSCNCKSGKKFENRIMPAIPVKIEFLVLC